MNDLRDRPTPRPPPPSPERAGRVPAGSPYTGGLPPVNDPVISRFAEACGATAPLDLRVDAGEGGVLAEGSGTRGSR